MLTRLLSRIAGSSPLGYPSPILLGSLQHPVQGCSVKRLKDQLKIMKRQDRLMPDEENHCEGGAILWKMIIWEDNLLADFSTQAQQHPSKGPQRKYTVQGLFPEEIPSLLGSLGKVRVEDSVALCSRVTVQCGGAGHVGRSSEWSRMGALASDDLIFPISAVTPLWGRSQPAIHLPQTRFKAIHCLMSPGPQLVHSQAACELNYLV